MNNQNKWCIIVLSIIIIFITWWAIDSKLYDEDLENDRILQLRGDWP